MKKCTDTKNFSHWPFVAEETREDGEKNNGGIDLISNPEQIEAIHEATEENGLILIIKQLNSKKSPFMTLGCGSGQIKTAYYSYLEFTFRDQKLARNQELNVSIESTWNSWLAERCKKEIELEKALKSHIVWEYREFSLHKAPPQFLVTVYLKAQNAADHGQLATWVDEFFKRSYLTDIESQTF